MGVYWEDGQEQVATIDALSFAYYSGTNYLRSVTDAAPNSLARPAGFFPGDGSGLYTYDKNGNLKSDPYKELQLVYNYLNLPETVTHNSNGGEVVWTYDASGTKLRKKTTTDILTLSGTISSGTYRAREIEASGAVVSGGNVEMEARDSIILKPGFSVEAGSAFEASIAPVSDLVQDYLGNIEYRNGELEAIYVEEGRVYLGGGAPRYEYTLTDHLGNARVMFADLDGNGLVNETEILQENHYYPFGMEVNGLGVKLPDRENLYLYNGKELNGDLGLNWLAYGARWYDASIGRWNSVDPLAESMTSWSPYNYTFNNPLKFTDPTGMAPEDDYRLNQDGTIELIRQTDDATDRLYATGLDRELTGKSIEVQEGILADYKDNQKAGSDLEGDEFSYVEISDNEEASKLFEFMAENTIIEFGHIKYDENGNTVTTSHAPLGEGGGTKTAYDKAVGGHQIKEKIHSHPTDGVPSDADKNDAKYWKSFPGQNITLKIYRSISKKYVEYDQNGEK